MALSLLSAGSGWATGCLLSKPGVLPDGPECMTFRHFVCPILYSVTGKLLIIFHDSPSSSPLCGVNLDHINIISTSGYITYWLYSFWATRTLWTYIYHRNCLMDEWIRLHNFSRKPAKLWKYSKQTNNIQNGSKVVSKTEFLWTWGHSHFLIQVHLV